MQEYERAVIFRLGRLRKGGAKVSLCRGYLNTAHHAFLVQGPGIFFIIPCIDSYRCVDLRTVSFDVPPQEVRLTTIKYTNKLDFFHMAFQFIQNPP